MSPIDAKSLTILWNSPAGMRTVALYSVSGMPRFSLLMSISFSSNSDTRSWAAAAAPRGTSQQQEQSSGSEPMGKF